MSDGWVKAEQRMGTGRRWSDIGAVDVTTILRLEAENAKLETAYANALIDLDLKDIRLDLKDVRIDELEAENAKLRARINACDCQSDHLHRCGVCLTVVAVDEPCPTCAALSTGKPELVSGSPPEPSALPLQLSLPALGVHSFLVAH